MDIRDHALKRWMLAYGEPTRGKTIMVHTGKTHCDQCGHSNGNHAHDAQAACLIPECDCEGLTLTFTTCERCNQDTSEYDKKFSRWCGTCRDEAEKVGVLFDLDDDPYRVDSAIGPWKVSYCCWASAKGAEDGVVCRSCYRETDHFDAPATLDDGDRFGRAPGATR